jgi:3D (Asp-Asp-Asp) domain-containing protein
MKNSFLLLIGIAVVSLSMWIGNYSVGSSSSEIAKEVGKAGEEIMAAEKRFVAIVREVTAYNVGVRAQTSDTPCIGAGGDDLCRLTTRMKVCAANFVPLGTILEIEKFGECVVLDRMHRRFPHRVDIAMRDHETKEAREFGLQRRIVQVKY